MKTYINKILYKRKNLSEKEYCMYSNEICQRLFRLEEYRMAENILVFYPYLGEVNILPFVSLAFGDGKKVFFPKVTGETTMEFIKVTSLGDFYEGYKGIKEPIGDILYDKQATIGSTLMIAPGTAFDKYGNRCGYGKGYYDRFLADCYKNMIKVGVCFSLQMMDKIPDVKETDIPMDYVISEINTIRSDR